MESRWEHNLWNKVEWGVDLPSSASLGHWPDTCQWERLQRHPRQAKQHKVLSTLPEKQQPLQVSTENLLFQVLLLFLTACWGGLTISLFRWAFCSKSHAPIVQLLPGEGRIQTGVLRTPAQTFNCSSVSSEAYEMGLWFVTRLLLRICIYLFFVLLSNLTAHFSPLP